EERRTAFFGEDVHIEVPSWSDPQVVFRPRTNSSYEVPLLQAGRVTNPNKTELNALGHLVLKDVQEEDEGLYIIRSSRNVSISKNLVLSVREPPPVLLYNQSAVLGDDYAGRLSVSDRQVVLHSVRMTDEGSFTVLDRDGHTKTRTCLNVRHQSFLHFAYGENLKMKLFLHYSNLNVVYRSKLDHQDRVIVNQGVLVAPLDPQLEGRLTVDGSELVMKKMHPADTGLFKVTDLAGFTVAHVYITVYKMAPLAVAILSMLGLIAFMLLVCLLSCLYKIHKRNEKNKKLTLIAQQAGKKDGEAFRQVVHEAYSRFTEESLMTSVCDKPSETTEVTIKGLEVSKPGRYQTLPSDNFLEMSDSGVEFSHSGLPLDSDTEAV
uniref:Uncharacterized protein n=1 Tax=Poecilia mexicana TaxID=48701 RepID=A0A3B3YWN7_9TELE